MTRTAPGFALLLVVLLLAGCGVGYGAATNTPVALPADLPAYPNTDNDLTTLDSRTFPQIAQYDTAQGFTFTSPDSAAAIRLWYKDQLTGKGWMVVADGAPLLGLTTANRDKLIELFFTPSGAGGTKVVAYYASGRKPTPAPLKSVGRGLTNRSLMRIIKRTQQRSSAVERWPSG